MDRGRRASSTPSASCWPGRSRGHTRRGRGLHGQGGRADGPPRHRQALLAAAAAGRRRDRRHPGRGGRSLQRGQGAAARRGRPRRCGVAPCCTRRAAARWRPDRRGHRARVRVGPRAGRAAVHLAAPAGPGSQLVGAAATAWAGESVAAYRRSWLHGFAVQVHRRLVEAERRAEERRRAGLADDPDVPGAELVLADRRSRVEQAYAEAFPALGRGRRSVLSGSGFAAGAAAGDRADLGAGALGGRPRL